MNDGKVIRLKVPELTEDRRRVPRQGREEDLRRRPRGRALVRRDSNDELKKMLKDKVLTEDDNKRQQDEVQKLTDDYIKRSTSWRPKKKKS